MVQARQGLGAGGRGTASHAFSVSVSLPLFCLVIGTQQVFLTSPQVTRDRRSVMNTQKENNGVCEKENVQEIGWECHWLLGEA